MKIGIELSYYKGSVSGEKLLEILDKYVYFTPYGFTKKHTTQKWNAQKHRKVINSASATDTIIITSTDYDSFVSMETGTKKPHQSIGINQDEVYRNANEIFLDSNLNEENGLIAAYIYNEDYIDIQSTPYSSNYAGRKYSENDLNSIINKPFEIDMFGNKVYDVSGNPGKMELIGFCTLLAAWKMWFKPPFFELVAKEHLLNFKDAFIVNELNDGTVFVQLFEDIKESSTPVNMERQAKWRSWLDFEKLKRLYP